MGIKEKIENKEREIRERYLEEAEKKGINKKDIEKLERVTKLADEGKVGGESFNYEEKLWLYGYKGLPMYEEYKIRKDLELVEHLENMGVTKITDQSGYIGVAQRKGGRLSRHLRYKKGKIELDNESYSMLKIYKTGKTLDEIASIYGMSKANVGYKLEILDPEYAYKYGQTSYNLLRDEEWVEGIKENIMSGYVDNRIKKEKRLPNVEILKVIRRGIEETSQIQKKKECKKEDGYGTKV